MSKIIIECTKHAITELIPLLEQLRIAGSIGHSLSIITDPDTKQYTKKFFFDGDGSSQIKKIIIEN